MKSFVVIFAVAVVGIASWVGAQTAPAKKAPAVPMGPLVDAK